MPENREAWAFFQEILCWSGGGFTKIGVFEFGDFSGALDIVLKFKSYRFTEFEIDALYENLKIIRSAIYEVNAEKLEQTEKRGSQT